MTDLKLYGPSYSSYTRVARMALAEKGVPYQLVEVDYVFNAEHKKSEHLARHPFAKLPVLNHDGFEVYEATAITRYVDDAFDGPRLQPSDPQTRARMNQIIGIVDSYVTPHWMIGIVLERLVAPMVGNEPNEKLIEDSKAGAQTVATVLDSVLAERTFCAGDNVSLADFFLYPQYAWAHMAPEVAEILEATPNITRWANMMDSRQSTIDTAYPEF